MEPPPPLSLLLKEGWDLPKIESLGGVRKFLLERGDKHEKGGVDIEMRWVATFLLLYSSITFTVCVCGGGSKVPFISLQYFELAIQDSHPCLYCTKTWYHLYISDPFW